jgi:cephalosporin-C deacetylase-like acetyl esterase
VSPGRSFLLVLVLLVLSQATFARQHASAQDGERADKQNNAKTVPSSAKVVENWGVLDDIKSGLEPRSPLEVEKDEQPEFVREVVRLQWRPNDPIDLWLMRPKKSAKVPLVLYLYGYPADSDRFRDNGWSQRATEGGFAAVGFVSALTGQRYHNRPMKQWFISELAESLGDSVHDVQLILNYLADRDDLDMEHVGMFGMGSGASIAILAAQADVRIKALDLLDPWGDWPDWLRESPAVPDLERPKYTTEEFLKSVAPLDPVACLPNLRTWSVRLQQTLSDPVTPKTAQERIADSLPDPSRLVKYANAEEHLKAYQVDGLTGWIKQQLRARNQATTEKGYQP